VIAFSTPSSLPQAKPHAPIPAPHLLELLLIFLLSCPLFAAPLTGTPLNDGYYALYNLDFNSAHAHFQQWITAHPEDCLGPASDAAAYIFNEFDLLGVLDIELFADDNRFTSRQRPAIDPALKQGFNDRIAQAERLADAALQRNPKDANAFYCKAVTSGMQADWASLIDRHEYGAYKFSELASKFAKQALALNPTLYRLLKLTAEQGHYLAPFARLMLAVGELRDGRVQQGKAILIGLSQEFPKNTLYQRQIARLH
jgi:hypothetical protein